MLIQKFRLQRGWSQEQLAELSGLSVRTIQRIENGKPASAESLKSLASVFEIEFSTLLPLTAHVAGEPPVSHPEQAMNPLQFDRNPLMQGVSHEEALALRHVRAVRGFYIHAAQYAVIIPLLALINLTTAPHKLWFFYPAMGWGLGLAFHAFAVFNKSRFFGAEWEKRQVEKILKRPL